MTTNQSNMLIGIQKFAKLEYIVIILYMHDTRIVNIDPESQLLMMSQES